MGTTDCCTSVLVPSNDADTTHTMGKNVNASAAQMNRWRQTCPHSDSLCTVVHLLQRPGEAEVQVRDGAYDEQDEQRHRGGQAVVGAPPAFKGQPVRVRNQDVRRARGR